MIVGLVAGGLLLLVLIAAMIFSAGGDSSKRYVVGAPRTAGGYTLADTTGTTSALMTQQQSAARATGARIDTIVSGFYKDPATSSFLPAGVIFVGGTGDMGDPETFIHGNGGAGSTAAGDIDAGGDGKAACVTNSSGAAATCMWATPHSFGMITPTTPKTVAEVTAILHKMRPDLEHAA